MLGFNQSSKIHFVGIGGIGMSGIAEVLLTLNYVVSGSDVAESGNVDKLRELGATVFIGHKKTNVDGVTILVVSSAIDKNNPELVTAKELGIPIMKRAEMLAELMRVKTGVAIAGTHGKTTTTSMLATILSESDLDITYIIGGIVENLGGHAKVGSSEYLIAEADESDGTFLLLNPKISLITNIDDDHMSFYKESSKLDEAFITFGNSVPFDGVCVLNGNDERVLNIQDALRKPSITYGINETGSKENIFHFEARNCKNLEECSTYDLYIEGIYRDSVEIKTPGTHNISNSLGALALALTLDVDIKSAVKGLSRFIGVKRRMDYIYKSDDLTIIDDYAHHPTELRAVLGAAREIYAKKNILAIFEPHRYSRTEDCWNEFLTSFNDIDELILLDIYPASERPIVGITAEKLAEELKQEGINVRHIKTLEEVFEKIDVKACSNRVILTLGAGAIGKKIREISSNF